MAASSLSAQIAIIEHVVPTAESFPEEIILGPDGAFWFTEYGENKIGRLTPAGSFTEYPVPTPDSAPYGITVGPDGALWFTEYFENKIGRITVNGVITEYPIPTPNSFPARITTGPDGALWFTQFISHKIGRITTQGVFTEYNLADGAYPIGITAGPDGALWFTESTANKIGRITTTGAITEFVVPTAFSAPQEITVGPDGALWFTEPSANKIGRISTAGAITEYNTVGGPHGITRGLDGTLWFTQNHGIKIARITTAGTITEYPVPSEGFLKGIALGPSGLPWFVESSPNRIGQVVFQTASLTVSPTTGIPGSDVTLTGAGFAAGERVILMDDFGLYRSATAGNGGGFVLTGPVRPSPYGPNSYVALGETSGKLGVAKFFPTPKVFATPSIVKGGDEVTVTGVGLRDGDVIEAFLDNQLLVGESVTDSHGTMAGNNAIKFTVPRLLPPGVHLVHILGDDFLTAGTFIVVQ